MSVCLRQEKFSRRKPQALEMRDVGNKLVSRSVCVTSRSCRVVEGSGSIMWWDLGKVVPMVMQRRMEEDRRRPQSVRQEVWGSLLKEAAEVRPEDDGGDWDTLDKSCSLPGSRYCEE